MLKIDEIEIRKANPNEFEKIGKLMVDVYSNLEGFPKKDEQPKYYQMLKNIGIFVKKPSTELLVAVNSESEILGAVVYFSDMLYYGSGGSATLEKNASGFRLLAVDTKTRGKGIGKLLTKECIKKTKIDKNKQLIIHTTKSMFIAWEMYEKLGFKRSEDLDFIQEDLQVFGFRLFV